MTGVQPRAGRMPVCNSGEGLLRQAVAGVTYSSSGQPSPHRPRDDENLKQIAPIRFKKVVFLLDCRFVVIDTARCEVCDVCCSWKTRDSTKVCRVQSCTCSLKVVSI